MFSTMADGYDRGPKATKTEAKNFDAIGEVTHVGFSTEGNQMLFFDTPKAYPKGHDIENLHIAIESDHWPREGNVVYVIKHRDWDNGAIAKVLKVHPNNGDGALFQIQLFEGEGIGSDGKRERLFSPNFLIRLIASTNPKHGLPMPDKAFLRAFCEERNSRTD